MKKLFFAFFAVLFAVSAVAQTGLTCEDPIPVDKSYTGNVEVDPEVGYKELWYTASTYDLPMHVYFSPDSMNSTDAPLVEIDFSCTTGDYSFDHKLDSVINILKRKGVTLPVSFSCDEVVRNGKVEWDLSIGEKYRDQLTEFGLTHNIQAFVKVIYFESGSISLTPDTAFQSCIEHGHYAQLGDTIDIAANDSSKMIVLPYSEWKNDSIRFVWIGDGSARIWVAEDECRFTPVDGSGYVKAKYDIDKNTSKKLYPADMQNAIDNWIGAGIFYAKVLSEGSGQLVIERIPLGAIQGDAILLERGKSVNLQANDDRVFCFPKTWKSTEFLANTEYLFDMYVSNTPEFEIGDANVITKYTFSKEDNNRKLQLSTADISILANFATDDYLYVRFQCNTATTLTPTLWNISSCIADNTILVTSGQTFSVSANSKSVYRLVYDDWKNHDFAMEWTGTKSLTATFASYCSFTTTATDYLDKVSVRKKSSSLVESSMIDGWISSIEDDGFVYFRLVASIKGNMTMTSTKPVEEDPKINPCVENSIELNANAQLTLNLDSAFTVYRINYAEWVAQNVTFQWTGETDLHTFIAETCQFAVAPYNRYVVDYVAIPANGEFVLDVETLSAFADKVDEDGYLYIRFLTEKEGNLSVTSY